MVRLKEFDEEIVVDKAIGAFLKDGYSSTSVSNLESATGIGRKSLYNTFGSKHELLLRALGKFAEHSTGQFIEPLERPGAGRREIALVVNAMVARAGTKTGRYGCLLCISAQDPIGSSKPVAGLVDDYFSRARSGFLKCVKAGIKAGEITSSIPPQHLADFFVGVLIGISTMARTGAARRSIENYANVALNALG